MKTKTKVTAMAGLKLKTARIGDTLYIFDDSTESTVRKNILPNGYGATFGDGSTEWIIDEAVTDSTKTGSAVYTWSKDGNRVKHERAHYRKDAAGNVTRTVRSIVYKTLD